MSEMQKIDIGSSTIIRTALIVLIFGFLYLIRDILVMLLAAIVIASAIEPLAKKLRRWRVPRSLSVVVVYLAVIGALGIALTLIVPALAAQSTQLAQSLPAVLAGLQDQFGLSSIFSPQQVLPQLQEGLNRFGNNLSNFSSSIFQQTRNVFSGLFSLVFVLIIAFYLVIEQDALKKVFRIIIPRDHLPYIELVIDRIQYKLGRWVLAQVTLGVIVGVAVGIGLWLIGVPHALALGLIAGVLEVLPVIGPIIAGIFGVLVALSQSLLLGVITIIFYIVVQQVENHALIPNIMRKATGLNPLVTIIAILLGGRLAGTVGIILSVPVATIISIFLSDFFTNTEEAEELAG